VSSTEKILKISNDDAMVQIVCGAREISSKNMLSPPALKTHSVRARPQLSIVVAERSGS